jgi:hypothetical protein
MQLKVFRSFIVAVLFLFLYSCAGHRVEVLVVGGGASGVTAGLQSARSGVQTLIIEETPWLGGMLTSAGVSAIDGNYRLPSGIFSEFVDSLAAHYGGADSLKTGWVSNVLFEPSAGNRILQQMVSSQANLQVWHETRFVSAERRNGVWKVETERNGRKELIWAKVLIDATELGDVAASVGVPYDIGMEARAVCGEDIAPEVANGIIQDLTYVMILKDYGTDQTIQQPENYNPDLFACAAKSDRCINPKPGQAVWEPHQMITYGKLPNGKFMINWPIEGNDYFVNIIEMNREQRDSALQKAKNFSLCFLYYMQTELGFNTLGLAKNEFPTEDHFPLIPYHRESRRIQGMVRFNVNHVSKPFDQPEALYRTGIGVGDYPIDHHHKRNPEWEKLPELHFYPVPSYNVPLGILIPKEHSGLIVAEKSVSVSNLLNGSTRLQPVVMQIGQAAGALAAIAVKKRLEVADVPVREVQKKLLDAGVYLMPYLDLPKTDVHFAALQRIGATGILKGKGMNVGWSNQTWFQADSLLTSEQIIAGIKEFEPDFVSPQLSDILSVGEAIELLSAWAKQAGKTFPSEDTEKVWNDLALTNFDIQRSITRKEMAVLIDHFFNPFDKQIDIYGKYNTEQ